MVEVCVCECAGGRMRACVRVRSSLRSVRFGQLLRCAHQCIVNIMKVYIERNNIQVELMIKNSDFIDICQLVSGKCACAVVTFANWEWFSEWENETQGKRGAEYENLKKEFAEQMWAQVVALYPQLKDKVGEKSCRDNVPVLVSYRNLTLFLHSNVLYFTRTLLPLASSGYTIGRLYITQLLTCVIENASSKGLTLNQQSKYYLHRCQPSRNRAGNPAFLVISRIFARTSHISGFISK